MEIQPYPELESQILERLKQEYLTRPKSEYPHMTQLVYCITKSYWDLTYPQLALPTDEEVMMFTLGFGLERVMLPNDSRCQTKIKDGIYYTPDFITLGGARAELKTTRASPNTFEREGYPESWINQIMGYCYAEEQTEYPLLVFHVCGDYKPPFPMPPKAVKLVFTTEELEVYWNQLLMRKEALLRAMEKKAAPVPFTWAMDWECGTQPKAKVKCRHLLLCQNWMGSGLE